MSAFHPAVRGILFAALTEHEQAAALAHLAAVPGTADSIIRYQEIIDGLNRIIAFTEPDAAGHAPIEGIEKMQRVHALMGSLIARLSDYHVSSWSVRDDTVSGMLHSSHGGDRASIRAIADRLGIAYSEQPHSAGSVQLRATGPIDGIAVEIWCLRTIERLCARHDAAVIDGICDGCENSVVEDTTVDEHDVDDEELQDEDQSATPARGHVQDDEVTAEVMDAIFGEPVEGRDYDVMPDDEASVLTRAVQLLENDDPDEDDELAAVLGLDDDEPVTHAPNVSGSMPLCGADGDDPVYSNRPTCPACRSLRPLKRRGATTPPTGDRP